MITSTILEVGICDEQYNVRHPPPRGWKQHTFLSSHVAGKLSAPSTPGSTSAYLHNEQDKRWRLLHLKVRDQSRVVRPCSSSYLQYQNRPPVMLRATDAAARTAVSVPCTRSTEQRGALDEAALEHRCSIHEARSQRGRLPRVRGGRPRILAPRIALRIRRTPEQKRAGPRVRHSSLAVQHAQ